MKTLFIIFVAMYSNTSAANPGCGAKFALNKEHIYREVLAELVAVTLDPDATSYVDPVSHSEKSINVGRLNEINSIYNRIFGRNLLSHEIFAFLSRSRTSEDIQDSNLYKAVSVLIDESKTRNLARPDST